MALTTKQKAGIWCLTTPTGALIVALVLVILANWAAGGHTSAVAAFMNLLAFVVGGLVVLTWFPGIIVGIVLLAMGKQKQ